MVDAMNIAHLENLGRLCRVFGILELDLVEKIELALQSHGL